MNVGFIYRYKLSTIVHWMFHTEVIHMFFFCEILDSCYLMCFWSEMLKVSLVCMIKRNYLC